MGRIAVPRYLIIILALVAGLWLTERIFQILYRIADILLIFGLAWLLKLLLDPLIRRLESLRVPRGAAIAIAYLLVLGGLISGLTWLAPQLTVLATSAPRLVRLLAARTTEIAESLQQFGLEVDPTALTNQITGAGTELASLMAARIFVWAQSIAGGIGRVVLVITVSVYMSLTSGRMTDVIRPVIPPRWRDEYDIFIRDVKTTYSSYIRGYFYMVALGTFTSGLLLYGLSVPNALLWLLAVFLFRLLPFIGGVLANSLMALVFVLTLSLWGAIIAILLLLGIQMLLTHAIMPRVMSRELGINPLLVLFAVLLGGRIYGVAGILFSIPAAAIIVTVVGKAINRYLLPLYETGGWWTAPVTVVENNERRSGHDRRANAPALPLDHEYRPDSRPSAPPDVVARPEEVV
jgi:putative heme transporter